MNWHELKNESQLADIVSISETNPVVVFKHSTRCSVSMFAKRRLEADWKADGKVLPYYLDLLNHRNISDRLSRMFALKHESPQLLLIKQGKLVYHASHEDVQFSDLFQQLN